MMHGSYTTKAANMPKHSIGGLKSRRQTTEPGETEMLIRI